MDFNLQYSFNENKNVWLVNLTGEIDIFNSPELKSKLLELVNQKNCSLVLDCENLEYMDSTGLGVLVAVLKNVKTYSGEVHLLNLRPNLSKLFKITNLDKVFVIKSKEEAQ